MDYPVYKIVVNDDDETGVEFVSLVDKPAIKKDFLLFQEFVEPGAKESEDEFISRCIPVMIGEGMEQEQAAAVCYAKWAQRKLQQIDMRQAYSVQDEEKRIISGPIMLANVPIYRFDDIRGEYYVTFPPDTIFSIVKKMARKGLYKAVNTDHANPVDEGVHMIELYLIDRERGVMPPKGYEDAEDGSAFASYLIDNDEIWTKIKAGEWKGFSVEGLFDMEQQDDIAVAMREIAAMLKNFAEEMK